MSEAYEKVLKIREMMMQGESLIEPHPPEDVDPADIVRTEDLFFGDGDDTQGIVSMEDVRGKMSDVWYDLNGRKLSGTPTCAGLYIVNGKKVIIK